MSTTGGRTARLGGEVRGRGLLGGNRSRVGNLVLSSAVALGMLLALGLSGLAGIGAALLLTGSAYVGTRQSNVTGRSPAREAVLRWRWWQRQRRGETVLLPVHLASPVPAPTSRTQRRATGRWARTVRDEAPGLEGLRWLSTPGIDTAVLLHEPAGERPYLSVAIEVDGQPPGLRAQHDYDRAAAAYGGLLARLAREGGLISGVQSVARIIPLDSAAHERWAADHIDPTAPGVLTESYAELVRRTAGVSEMVRHHLVIRLPLSVAFAAEARSYGKAEQGWTRLAVEQAEWVASQAIAADLRQPRLVTVHGMAALLRHLQNPSWPLDQTVDVGPDTWLRPAVAHRRGVVTDDAWWHRVAAIPRSGVTPEPVHTRWIAPLLHGLDRPVHRTISLCVAVQPAAQARRQAREDLTVDLGLTNEAARRGAVDDGTQAVQMSASAQRLADLQPGSGVHGAAWTGWICVSAQSFDDALRASTAVADAAGECGIGHLDWLDRRHDEALPATWPVFRGMEVPG